MVFVNVRPSANARPTASYPFGPRELAAAETFAARLRAQIAAAGETNVVTVDRQTV